MNPDASCYHQVSVEGPSSIEKEAILLRWRSLHPGAPVDALPTAEESAELLLEIRERIAGPETETIDMLSRSLVPQGDAQSKASERRRTTVLMTIVYGTAAFFLAYYLFRSL
jgi:hypothetical protein